MNALTDFGVAARHLVAPIVGYYARQELKSAFYKVQTIAEFQALLTEHLEAVHAMIASGHAQGVWFYNDEQHVPHVSFQRRTVEMFSENCWMQVL